MRKILTSTMIAGAALLVAACGGEAETNNAADTNLGEPAVIDPMTPVDNTGMDNGMAPVDNALENAGEAVENAGEAIDNAQEATQ